MTYFDAIATPGPLPVGVPLTDVSSGGPALAPRPCGDEDITVERIASDQLSCLASRAFSLGDRALDANVFMDPATVLSAAQALPDRELVTFAAWRGSGSGKTLVGLWSFAVASPANSILKAHVLSSPASPHAYLATPLIDREGPDRILDAFLSAIESDARLPKTVVVDPVSLDSNTMRALSRVLASRGSAPYVPATTRRPVLRSGLDGKQYLEKALSSATRKKLRQHRRRLEEKGKLEFRRLTEVQAVNRAFDEFMALEARGWKGRRGTALLCNKPDATFATAMIAALAERGQVAVYALYLDRTPVSIQIVLRSGAVAFTWKTAYDESFSDFSPGMLLLEEYTRDFLSDRSIDHVDSCAYDDSGFMSAWVDRQTIGQVWISARRGRSLYFDAACRAHFVWLEGRRLAKRMTASWRRKWMRR